ncbi:MAG TPA: hypothetical protein VIJ96_04230 [Acidothermaceae bacterium]
MNDRSADAQLAWARNEAARLLGIEVNTSVRVRHIRAELSMAVQFLANVAPGTTFAATARDVFDNGDLFAPNATRNVAGALEAWVLFVEAGMMAAAPFEVRARVEAATDLMDQVQQLIDTPGVHYAAPVVLAGAGLEEFLRSRVIALGLSPSGKPGIQAYADALRGAQDLTSQEVKSITAWAGQRNDAAHGTFEGLSKQRSQIMADGINLFLSTKGT